MKLDRRSLFLAVTAHGLLVLLLVFSFDIALPQMGGKEKIETIETHILTGPVMSTTEIRNVEDQKQKLRAAEELRKKEELQRQAAIAEEKRQKEEAQRKQVAEQKRKQEVESKQKAEEAKKLAELKKQKDAEAKKKAEADQKLKAEEAEKKRIADEAAKKKAAEEAEKKRLADEAAKKKAAEDAKRKAEEAERRKAQEALEAQMADELAAEEASRARAAEEARQRSQLQPVLARWVSAMRNKVARNWLRPPGGSEYFECSVFVKQLNNGEVLDVKIEESCGSDVLNESVRKAVLKASPLPLPEDMRVFKNELIFVFKPD